MASRRSRYLNWQFAAVTAAAVIVFFLTLFGLSRYVDQMALVREKSQLQSTVNVAIGELARRITPIADWDDAIAHLDRSFDAAWATRNIGEYFVQNDSLPVSFVLDSENRPVLAMLNGRAETLDSYRAFRAPVAPLLAEVRAAEQRRGPLRPPFHATGDIVPSIQATGIVRIGNVPFVTVASLVQPDMGKTLPRGARSPVLVNAEPLAGAFLRQIGARLLMPNLRFSARARHNAAAIAVSDVEGHVAGHLLWQPWTPGADLILFAFLPILLGVAVPLALYLRSRAMAARLTDALGELSQARDRADAALESARESDHAKAQFLANMSHELRTPLNAIMGFSEMLKSEAFRASAEEYADIIHRSAQFLLSLINDILDMSKIDAGKIELVESDIALPALIDDCIAMMRPKAETGHLIVESEASKDLPKLRGDARYVRQILLNLLSNATKFTDAGGSVVVSACTVETGELSILVTDTGRGIAPEDQARVFENFGQGRHDIVTGDQGTGLGLPIVRGLMQAHGGRVTLESAPGEGTSVALFFPPDRVMHGTGAKRAA